MSVGQVVHYPKGVLVDGQAVGAHPRVRPGQTHGSAPTKGNGCRHSDLPANLLPPAHNGSTGQRLLALRDGLPDAARPLVSYEQVERCQIKGITQLTKMACILRQVALLCRRTVTNVNGAAAADKKQITNAQFKACIGCPTWLSDADYTEVRRKLGTVRCQPVIPEEDEL